MKRLLILGGGHGQLPLLRHVTENCISVVLQDKNPRCPGRLYAEHFVEADTWDAKTAAAAAQRYSVDGSGTAGTDQPVLAAALAAEAAGCPVPINSTTARALTDKEVMKKALTDAGIAVPAFRFLSPEDNLDVRLKYPLVLKPVDSQGQRGVFRVESPEEAGALAGESFKWSRRRRLIAEQYHQSREVTVSGWVWEGRMEIWAVTDRVTKEHPPSIGLCLAHRYPSAYAWGREKDIANLTKRCVEALGMENGPLYFQFLITSDGEILVNECAGRLGGAYEDMSLPPVCGKDILALQTAAMLKGGADPMRSEFSVPISAGAFGVPLMFCRPGRIHRCDGERAVRSLPGVSAFSYLQEPGTLINSPENSVQRAAYLVVHGRSTSEVNRILKRAHHRMAVWDKRGRQLLDSGLAYVKNPR